MLISLSILEYETELSKNLGEMEKTAAFNNILRLINTGKIHDIHVDVMRPPMIPRKVKFSIDLLRRLYEALHGVEPLTIHLMVGDPMEIINSINDFIYHKDRESVTIILQVESFESEDKAISAIKVIRGFGYRVGVSLNLPTPIEKMTDRIVGCADLLLIMSVPMGKGGQKFSEEALWRIRHFSTKFPSKIVSVDGGINPKTIVDVYRAGAKIAVVGSYITRSKRPELALLDFENALEKC